MLYDKKWDEKKIEAPAQLEPWRKLLLDAAEDIEKYGWCQGCLTTLDGRLCLMEALHRNAGLAPDFWKAYRAVSALIGGGEPALWQDRQDRTALEVISALRSAADLRNPHAGRAG